MIRLKFSNTRKNRSASYQAMQLVADDVMHFNRKINRITDSDNNLPCPSPLQDDTSPSGIANCSELWFGTGKQNQTLDLQVNQNKDVLLVTDDKNLNLLFKVTCLSLCEQFIYTKIESDENWDEAIALYEDSVGAIPANAAKCLGRKGVV